MSWMAVLKSVQISSTHFLARIVNYAIFFSIMKALNPKAVALLIEVISWVIACSEWDKFASYLVRLFKTTFIQGRF